MNLFTFIDKYGCYTFDEVEFTEIDNVILSMLSYLNLDGIVSRNRYDPRKLKRVGDIFFSLYDKKATTMLAAKNAVKVLKDIMNTRRYGDLLLYNYIYKSSGDNQFGALTIELNRKLVYVSFEGTDHLISGWKEDFMMTYEFPVLAQRMAIDYVNRNFLFRRKNIILGGHSKGGNLALVAGMYANFLVKDKIIRIYNNDGPGLLVKQFNSKEYRSIESKIIYTIPNYSVFGLFFECSKRVEVVRSFRKSLFAHDPLTWVVNDMKFERVELSNFSKKLDVTLHELVEKYDEKQWEKYVTELFNIFERANIVSLVDIVENKKLIFNFIAESKEMDSETRKFSREILSIMFDCVKNVPREELEKFFIRR